MWFIERTALYKTFTKSWVQFSALYITEYGGMMLHIYNPCTQRWSQENCYMTNLSSIWKI